MINLTAQVSRTRVIRRAKRPPREKVLEWVPRSHFGTPRAILTVKTQWSCSVADQRGQREGRAIEHVIPPRAKAKQQLFDMVVMAEQIDLVSLQSCQVAQQSHNEQVWRACD